MGLKRLRDLGTEVRARSRGRRRMGVDRGIGQASRGIMGMIGAGTSTGWRYLEENATAYNRSLEPARLPPSLFVSERDGVRRGAVVPVSERCLEEPGAGVRRSGWSMAELDNQ